MQHSNSEDHFTSLEQTLNAMDVGIEMICCGMSLTMLILVFDFDL